MKRILLMLTIATLAIATFGQEYQIIDTKLKNDSKVEWIVQKNKESIQRLERDFKIKMMAEDRLYDTIYHKTTIDALINSKWNEHASLVAAFSEPDTFIIEKIGVDYFENGDTTSIPLNVVRNTLIAKYNRLEAKYGELVTYDKEFRPIKEKYDKLQDWLTQIQSQ